MRITLSLERHWNETAWKTANNHPAGAPAFLLTWEPDPWPTDGGIPVPLIAPLARALASLGPIAFRLFWPPEPATTSVRNLPQPSRPLITSIVDRMTRRVPPTLALAIDEAGLTVFLDQGWSTEGQLGFLFQPKVMPDRPLLTSLFMRRTWRSFTFPATVQALIAAPTDGDGLFVSARTGSVLSHIANAVVAHVSRAGFDLTSVN